MQTEIRTIGWIYALLGASVAASLAPVLVFAAVAVILFTIGMAGAYRLRRKRGPDSLTGNHMTYLIRTIWLTAAVMSVTLSVAIFYVLSHYDSSALMPCADRLLAGTGADMTAIIKPCLDEFIRVNWGVFINGSLIGGAPAFLYFAYRLIRGFARAAKGYRIANVKGWL